MSQQDRVLGEKREIDYLRTHTFFEGRAKRHNKECVYTSTMYQDANPALVLQRDLNEKQRILPYLSIQENDAILDVGCGVGRWADAVKDIDCSYLGLDFSENLLQIAKANHTNKSFQFQCISAQAFTKRNLCDQGPFNKIICAGIFIYLNDGDVIKCLRNISEVSAKAAVLYIREPIGVETRLTLDAFYSEELKANYTGIYRTSAEYQDLFQQGLAESQHWEMERQGELFNADLKNRQETTQYFYILRRDSCER